MIQRGELPDNFARRASAEFFIPCQLSIHHHHHIHHPHWGPVENLPPKSSEFHVNWECGAVSNERRLTGVSNFILSCDLAGISRHNSFFLYVNGYHLSLPRSDLNECLVRAECLRYIRQAWIDRFV